MSTTDLSNRDWEIVSYRTDSGDCVPARLYADCDRLVIIGGDEVDTTGFGPEDWAQRLCNGTVECEPAPGESFTPNPDGSVTIPVEIVNAQAASHTYQGPNTLVLTPGAGDPSVLVGNVAPYVPTQTSTSGILFDFSAVDALADCSGDVDVRLFLDQESGSGTVLHLWQSDGSTAYTDSNGTFGGVHRGGSGCLTGQSFNTTPWPATCMEPTPQSAGRAELWVDYTIPASDLAGGLQATLMSINPPADAPIYGLRIEVTVPASDVDCLNGGTPIDATPVAVVCPQPLPVTVVPPDPEPECTIDYLIGCDDVNGDGSLIVNYLRPLQTCTLNGTVISQEALPFLAEAPDGTLQPYTPTNPVACDPASFPFAEEFYCDTGATPAPGVSFIRRTIVVAGQGTIVEQVELDGSTPYTPVGPVTAGACSLPISGVIVAPEFLCVSLDGGTTFTPHGVATTAGLFVPNGQGVLVAAAGDIVISEDGCDCPCLPCDPDPGAVPERSKVETVR